jgi:hypothetical protein
MNASIKRVEWPMVITTNGIAGARCFIHTSDCSPSSMSAATKRPPENDVQHECQTFVAISSELSQE